MQHSFLLGAVLMVFTIAPSSALSSSFMDKAKKDSAVEMNDEEPAMQKAMKRARTGLDDFLRKVGSPPPETDYYSVKVRVREGTIWSIYGCPTSKHKGSSGPVGSIMLP